jgi:hypothetical protein
MHVHDDVNALLFDDDAGNLAGRDGECVAVIVAAGERPLDRTVRVERGDVALWRSSRPGVKAAKEYDRADEGRGATGKSPDAAGESRAACGSYRGTTWNV